MDIILETSGVDYLSQCVDICVCAPSYWARHQYHIFFTSQWQVDWSFSDYLAHKIYEPVIKYILWFLPVALLKMGIIPSGHTKIVVCNDYSMIQFDRIDSGFYYPCKLCYVIMIR